MFRHLLACSVLACACIGCGDDVDSQDTGEGIADGSSQDATASDAPGSDATASDATASDVPGSDTGPLVPPVVACSGTGERLFESPTALPEYYETYCFPEPAAPECNGAGNETTSLEGVLFAQTHLLDPEWPFFFLIAERPALVQALVTGTGTSPEVSVSAWIGEDFLGTRCMAGPETLPDIIDDNPQSSERFTVTIPASWMRVGLRLEVVAGTTQRDFSAEELGLRHSNDINIAMINVDVANYNDGSEDTVIPAALLEDFAGALPGRQVRFGEFPARLKIPNIPISPADGLLMLDRRLCRGGEDPEEDECFRRDGVDAGLVNGSALRFINALHRATGEFPYSVYFGNTQQLNPGGWGGGRSFVSIGFGNVTIHEAGHALSLPHWGNAYDQGIETENGRHRNYPYGGETDNGGGRGTTWNYHQQVDLFSSPTCSIPDHQFFGLERSDAMQRARICLEMRGGEAGPWDGFSDFSALSMFNFQNGSAAARFGEIPYRGGTAEYQVRTENGFPTLELNDAGEHVLNSYDTGEAVSYESQPWAVPEQWGVPVYAVSGVYNVYHPEVNTVYAPMRYTGTLPHVIDPTDPEVFAQLVDDEDGVYDRAFRQPRDITVKLIYADGSESHALFPHAATARSPDEGAGIWRPDLVYWALVLPDEGELMRIEYYRRPFLVHNADNETEGNAANPDFNIRADNFMADAELLSAVDL